LILEIKRLIPHNSILGRDRLLGFFLIGKSWRILGPITLQELLLLLLEFNDILGAHLFDLLIDLLWNYSGSGRVVGL
jgi:hypothetical protein